MTSQHNSIAACANRYQYDPHQGLTREQIEDSRREFGRNALTPPARESWLRELLKQFDDPTIKILLAAAALSLIVTAIERWLLGNHDASFLDSTGVFLAVGLAAVVSFLSERKSAKEFEALSQIRDDFDVKAIRDGKPGKASVADLVVGDVVELAPGDMVPADGVILEEFDLYVDQSPFTGESIPARKRSYPAPWSLDELRKISILTDERCLARGSTVSDGYALMLVTQVGDASEMGRIAKALETADEDAPETPLTQKLARLADVLSLAGVTGAALIFTVMNAVSLAHSAVARALLDSRGTLVGLALCSALLAYLLERLGARPLLKKSGVLRDMRIVRAVVFVVCVVACMTLLSGLWGAFSAEPLEAAGFALVKSVLLAFVVAVTIVVVAVPEGLPMMTTISLALNMRKMARENCLVRRLVASETIGSATVVCTDKTGTLTQNKMTPTFVSAEGRVYEGAALKSLPKLSAWPAFVRGIAVNSRADLRVEPSQTGAGVDVTGIGNPTECALLRFLMSNKIDYNYERFRASDHIFDLAHNSDRKFSAACCADETGVRRCLIKGAPERVLARCSSIMIEGRIVSIEPYQGSLRRALTAASEKALRVLGFCERVLDDADVRVLRDGTSEEQQELLARPEFVLVGLIGIEDPPRPEAREAVELCRGAGIQVKMITGDAEPTALAIAKSVGIKSDGDDALVMTSEEFGKVSDEDLPGVAERISLLARATPADKLRMVRALHQRGEVVAMTGDGTNDAPALKAADVGLSMGLSGTEVAKEASDIVLMDDNFRSVATGVWWGRSLFQNIRRFLQFQLSVNFTALVCSMLGPLFGEPLPLTVTQLLWINIIMDTFAALALSTEPPRPGVMTRKPIPRLARLITPSMAFSIGFCGVYQVICLFAALFGGWFITGQPWGPTETDAENLEDLTVFFTILVMFQFWHKFNCRTLTFKESPFYMLRKNRMFIAIVLTITAVQIAVVQIPALGVFFRTTPLNLIQWLEIIAFTSTIIPVAWLGRYIAHRLGLDRE